ncbi:EF-hand calcium-binding domain-containing protein 10 [Protobothrops mucrosquamatus]|uniref:EF-hand calcium-binding domain-containing protein 10 n=1 Tax=Protobothrops mucrosquamatus TaxID=103944 RepID=UPI000775BEE9|nr:EF-hand calcium-binding domain-containing protein 10 [Protobothrops mucrosquamatus]
MDRETEGRGYLAQHKIPELLYSLTSLLLYHRPERPREFLIKTLEKVKIAKASSADYPNLMDESNLDAMFDMIDVGGEGYINVVQYKGALESLGLSSQDVIYNESAMITSNVFKENLTKKFAELWTTV